ncbi:MAG: biotin--[acetyl-CoA-carboxylase] ligase [Peptococcaceae bacterium]|jgi:BirA family biotin operon repressor/biotin-[acetyl-CoA-carboxylase] ligase|nr:biotin--[acetyl-CoA-carboxylase] ligase [Peptococcaceae bacterium]
MVNEIYYENKERSLRPKKICLQGRDVYIYREVSSTNSIAKSLAVNGVPDGTIVLSRFQTAGKGRFQRQWVCPPGKGLLLSMILRPNIDSQSIPQLTLLGGVVVAESIQKICGIKAGIKWPNDILINGRKVCGMLAQNSFSRGHSEFVVLGIGINVNLSREQLPADCRETTTSLLLEAGFKVSRLDLLKLLLSIWDRHYHCFLQSSHSYLRPLWLANNITLGREVSIKKDTHTLRGKAVDISPRGGLIVAFPDGAKEEYLAEDVSLGKEEYYAGFEHSKPSVLADS